MGYALDECYGETYELWQCAKAGSLAGLSLVTLVVALYLFLRRARRERAMSVPVLLLAMVAAEALLCIFHWILSEENQVRRARSGLDCCCCSLFDCLIVWWVLGLLCPHVPTVRACSTHIASFKLAAPPPSIRLLTQAFVRSTHTPAHPDSRSRLRSTL